MPSNVDATALLTEIRKKILAWEIAPPGSRQEQEAAEAATRAMAELDIALCDGAHLPVPWQRAQYPHNRVTADIKDQHTQYGKPLPVSDAEDCDACRSGNCDGCAGRNCACFDRSCLLWAWLCCGPGHAAQLADRERFPEDYA